MSPNFPDDELLKPKEVAELFGVSVRTITMWVKAGRLKSDAMTPGGQRRYRMGNIRTHLESLSTPADLEQERLELDAVRLYEQGWTIRQVADKFDYPYSTMRRILRRHTALRPR